MSPVRATLRARVGLLSMAWFAVSPSVPAEAQSRAIAVSRASEAILRLDPLQRANVPFRIVAKGRSGTIGIRIDRPAGWRAIAPPMLVLPHDSVALRILSFMVPSDAPAGVYTLRLHAVAGDGRSAVDSVNVIVTERVRLEVDVEDMPRWVLPTDTFSVTFRMFNRGNAPMAADVRLDASSGVHVETTAATGRLGPGESRALHVRVFPELGRVSGADRVLRLTAFAGAYSTSAVARVDVLDNGGADRVRGLPGTLRVRMTDASAGRPYVQLNASGPIREGSATRAHILVQGPHTDYSLFSATDVYRAALESRTFSLRLGDHIYALSPLTSTGRETSGGGGDIRFGPVGAGGFISWNRRSQLRSRNQGAFVRLNAGKTAALGINWLQQEEPTRTRDVASVSTKLRAPGGWLHADGEYGLLYNTDARAYSVQVRTDRGAVSAEVRRLRADSAFGGSHGGSTLDAAHLALRPGDRFFMEASAEQRGFERPALNASFSNTIRTSRIVLGFGHFLGIVRHQSMLHDSPLSQMDRMAQSAGARLRIASGGLALMPQIEIGRSRDHLTGMDGRFWRAATSVSITSSRANYTGQFEYFTGGTLHSASFGDGMRASFSADMRPTPFTRISLSANGARYFDDPEYRSVFATSALEHKLPYGHTIVLRTGFRGGTAGQSGHSEFVVAADYRIPFRLPVLAGPATGSIRGRIYDAESGVPLVRAVIDANGSRAATGADGRFELRGLAPGAHRVRVNSGTAGHRIMVEQAGLIDVQSGTTTTLDIPMIAGAHVSGTLAIVRRSPASQITDVADDQPAEPLSGAVVELVMDNEQIRRATDEHGRFDIADLRPGRWSVSVVSAKLPAHFRFEPDTLFIDLAPGATLVIELRATSADRPVRMLTIVSQAPTARDQSGRSSAAAPTPATRTRAQSPRKATPELSSGWTVFNVPEYMKDLREVARVVYLETGLWPKIWLANRDAVPNPDRLTPGTALKIPPRSPLSGTEQEALREYMRTRW